jgi:uncharacterized protein (DUF885 family)
VLPAVVLEGWESSVNEHVVDDAAKSLLFKPFTEFPETVPQKDRARLTARGKKAVMQSVVPGYQAFSTFMAKEYVPACRKSIGASELPDGKAYYAYCVRHYTTLNLTPQQVHDTGLAEVKRIRGEMDAVIAQSGFKGSFTEFLEFMRTDPRFYVDTPEALLEAVGYICKKADGQLPSLFKTLPRMPYGVKPVPDFIADKTSTAYYEDPTGDGTKAGFYFVNTSQLPSRPLYELEALSLHEAVPGHHLQIAIMYEIPDVPNFRRYDWFTAFVEGWGLYSERLGLELGFYQDPYSNFGRLTYEMWRAMRLVVDTGMHSMGWTRQQAIDYMAANGALSMHNVTTEVDRYISWPGQALAYKTGELKFRELRAYATKECARLARGRRPGAAREHPSRHGHPCRRRRGVPVRPLRCSETPRITGPLPPERATSKQRRPEVFRTRTSSVRRQVSRNATAARATRVDRHACQQIGAAANGVRSVSSL